MTPAVQLQAISQRVHRMVQEQEVGVLAALGQLAPAGICAAPAAEWTEPERKFLLAYFSKEIFPVLTPLAVEELHPAPRLPGLQWHVAAVLYSDRGPAADRRHPRSAADFPLGPPAGRRPSPGPAGRRDFGPRGPAFPRGRDRGHVAVPHHPRRRRCHRARRADDLLEAVEQAVLTRQRRPPVRLQVSPAADPRIRAWLDGLLKLEGEQVYEMDSTLDAAPLMELANWPGFEQLKNVEWPPQPPRDLLGSDDLFEAVADHDVLLFHPYESFEPVVRLLEQAAADPNVLAVKQTLYRTSGNSPIVRALGRAAQSGKEVTVLVELRARFDEARNIQWARRLEDLGAHVIYGIAGYKTHAKALLIVRREGRRIQRYVHLATGNYNDRTAKLYSDLGLMTTDRDIATDVAAFFNLLTGVSETVGWLRLAIAPTGLQRKFIDLIDREIQVSTPDRPGLIMAKVNSLEDPEICRALYRAAGPA